MNQASIPTARDIMTRHVITLRAEMRVIDAMRELIRCGISGAPVVNADGALIGIVSEFDCLRIVASGLYGHEDFEDSALLSEVMTADVVTIGPEADVFAITQLLVDKRIRRVPVAVDGRVIGIVSRRDVLPAVHELRRQHLKPHDPPRDKKGLYLSATHEGGELSSRLE